MPRSTKWYTDKISEIKLIYPSVLDVVLTKENCLVTTAIDSYILPRNEFSYLYKVRKVPVDFDLYYSNDLGIKAEYRSKISKIISSIGGNAAWSDPVKSELTKEKMKGRPAWNSGMDMKSAGYVSWNIGQSKHTNEKLMQMSISRLGEGNPSHKIKDRVKWAQNVSDGIQSAIQSGKYTPRQNNYKTHWGNKCLDKNFRSSWEAVFYYANPKFQFEKIRIPYIGDDGRRHIIITDFYDPDTKTIYEIKPTKFVKEQQTKILAIKEYCDINDFNFNLISEVEIKEYFNRIYQNEYMFFSAKCRAAIEKYNKNRVD